MHPQNTLHWNGRIEIELIVPKTEALNQKTNETNKFEDFFIFAFDEEYFACFQN